jgi:tetratricopeptide (TPR) repeat protein
MAVRWYGVSVLALGLILGTGNSFAADRDTASALLSSAEDLYKKSMFDKALEMAQRAIAADDSYAQAYMMLGQCQEQSRKPREAMKNYSRAEELARKVQDTATANKAASAGEKLAPGLKQVAAANQRMLGRVLPIAQSALAAGQYETALDAFNVILAVQSDNAEAKAGAEKAKAALDAKGNPIKAKIAENKLAEYWYYIGLNQKEKAGSLAQELTSNYSDTKAGQEATSLAGAAFKPPAKEEQLALKKQLMEERVRQEKVMASPVAENKGPASGGTISARPASPKLVDVDALDKKYEAEVKKLPKDKLIPTFMEVYTKGNEAYAKAVPNTDGCQQNLRIALEQYIYCDALGLRISDEKLSTNDLEQNAQDASMKRYGCMKMTILSH